MKSFSRMRSLLPTLAGLAVWLFALVSFGKAPDRPQVQARLLDHVELPCDNCFFGPSDYYFCFEADNKVLIGYQRTPVLNWRDTSKNYLTKVHKQWIPWTAPGETVPISYDDKHIWVTRPNGKQVKLILSHPRDIFTNDDRCRNAPKPAVH